MPSRSSDPTVLLFGSGRPGATLAGNDHKVRTETVRALDALGVSEAVRVAILGGTATRLSSIDR